MLSYRLSSLQWRGLNFLTLHMPVSNLPHLVAFGRIESGFQVNNRQARGGIISVHFRGRLMFSRAWHHYMGDRSVARVPFH
jgi:hypothetical protein